MIEPTIRLAVASDCDELVLLERNARSHLVGQRGGDRWLDTHPAHEFTALVARSEVAVAEVCDLVVGYIVITPGHVATIASVFVRAEAREVGCGDGLVEWAVATCRSAGSAYLEAEALPGDRDTKNLYERAGIKARLITVSTEL